MKRYRGFVGQVSPLAGLGITRLSYEQNGYGDRLAYRRSLITNGTISPTTTTQATSTIPGRAADGSILPGWAESYCVPGSSVRKTLPGGGTTCPMYYRGVTETVMEAAMRELMEPDAPVATKPYKELPVVEPSPVLEPTPIPRTQIPVAKIPPLPEGWTQVYCAQAPCPPFSTPELRPWDLHPSNFYWKPEPGKMYPAILQYSSNPDIRLEAWRTKPVFYEFPTVSPADQELEKRQYAEGGDGTADVLEKTAKIDEAIKRVTDGRITTPTMPAPDAAKPNLLPLVIGAGLIWLMM